MTQINYKKIGSGSEAVIVMHEWMGDHTNYDKCLEYLNEDDFTWILIDFRGYGLSKDLNGKFDLHEMTSDIKALIRFLELKDFHLLGHSMSSMVAQKLALELKESIKTLILVTPILPSGIKMTPKAKEKLLNDVKEKNGVIEQVVQSASKRYNEVWKQKRIELAHNCSTIQAKLGYMNMYLSNDFANEIKGLETKIRVLLGKYDLPAFHKNSLQKHFVNIYPNIEIVECQEAGHYPMIECPVFFANKIEEFIKN